MNLLDELAEWGWRPGLGDPTPGGWAVVAASLVTAITCWLASGAERHLGPTGRELRHGGSPSAATAGRRALFWKALATTMVLFGMNKQLDLQTLIPVFGRRVALEQGWYEGRQVVQRAFVASLAVAGTVLVAILTFLFRSVALRRPLTLLGLVCLLAFVLLRAATFHNIDSAFDREILSTEVNRLIELGGILCVFGSAVICLREARRPAEGRRSQGIEGREQRSQGRDQKDEG